LPLLKGTWSSMMKRPSIMLCGALFANGAMIGIYYGALPLIATNVGAWESAELSALSGSANLLAGLLGVCLFGIFTDKVGWKKATLFGFGAMIVLCIGMALAQGYWSTEMVIMAFVYTYLAFYTLLMVTTCAAAMHLCKKSVAATQFTLYMAIANLGTVCGGLILSPVESLGGYPAMIIAISIIGLFGIMFVRVINFNLTDDNKKPDTHEEAHEHRARSRGSKLRRNTP